MKPIYLEIEGLQSYKTLQKIDFEKLMKNGLFGIFGHTGSGKSTVLDAITLALYGKVSRAARGTQGIMNNECDRMRVLFEFSILTGEERNKYRIERTYARKNETSYDIKTARMFLCRNSETIPLAEKSTDIDAAVKELIGLEYEDFTRAVVLPQNKFQEFLNLEKSKKLAMLERLFGLEEYGEKLAESVKVKLYELEKEFENVKGQLSAITGADDEALSAARTKFENLKSQKDTELLKHKAVEEEYFKVKDLYETSINIIKFENDLKEGIQEKDYYERIKSKVTLSRKAKDIEPLWESYKDIAKEIKRLETSLEEISNNIIHNDDQIDRTSSALKIASQNAETTLPGLYEQKAKLDQGKGLQDKYDFLLKEIEKNSEKTEVLKENILKITEEKNKIQISRNEISASIGKFDQFFNDNKPKLARRSVLMEGQRLENEYTAAKKEAETAKIYLDKLADEISRTENSIKESEAKSEELIIRYNKRKSSVESTINQYKSFKEDYIQAKSVLEEEVERLRIDETAYRIATTLEDASPCPVCGSMHHPAPARLNEQNVKRMEECKAEIKKNEQEIEEAEKIILGFTNGYNNDKKSDILIEIDQLGREIAATQTKSELLTEKLEEKQTEYNKAKMSYDTLERISIEKNNVLSRYLLSGGITNISEELSTLSDIVDVIGNNEKEVMALREKSESLLNEFNEVIKKQGQLETELAVLNSTNIQNNQTVKELSTQLGSLVSEGSVYDEIEKISASINQLLSERDNNRNLLEELKTTKETLIRDKEVTKEKLENRKVILDDTEKRILELLDGTGITSPNVILQAKLSEEMENNYNIEISQYEEKITKLRTVIAVSREKLAGKTVTATEFDTISKRYEKVSAKRDEIISGLEVAKNELEKLEESNRKWKNVSKSHIKLREDIESYTLIKKLISGNKFVEYIAEESLRYVLAQASEILGKLTGGRYRIELGPDSEFVVKDFFADESYRGVSTLSGGETFLTSLSLAVALSKQIQLKGKSPLEFFFLDEGFGSLDSELLETVLNSLEMLVTETRAIGLVSHLKELQERIPCRLYVKKDEFNSSKAIIETA